MRMVPMPSPRGTNRDYVRPRLAQPTLAINARKGSSTISSPTRWGVSRTKGSASAQHSVSDEDIAQHCSWCRNSNSRSNSHKISGRGCPIPVRAFNRWKNALPGRTTNRRISPWVGDLLRAVSSRHTIGAQSIPAALPGVTLPRSAI